MLIFYSKLRMGGIETFIVRLCKHRYQENLTTTIILLEKPSASDPNLLQELQRYSQVYFGYELFFMLPIIGKWFVFLNVPKNKRLKELISRASIIHTMTASHAILIHKILMKNRLSKPIQVGVYHSQEFCWQLQGQKIPYYEKINRDFIFNSLPSENLLCFAQSTKNFIKQKSAKKIIHAKTFRLGVIDSCEYPTRIPSTQKNTIKICTVGRLVSFKTYNIWMIDIIDSLQKEKYNIIFDIYGDGPLQNALKKKIIAMKLENTIQLKGYLDYSLFNKTISNYDLFIGSGTAIIQAASLRVPSIIGIESIKKPETYGYFNDFHKEEYHHPDLPYKKTSVKNLIKTFTQLNFDERISLSKKHAVAAKLFDIKNCSDNLAKKEDYKTIDNTFKFNRILYVISYFFFQTKCIIKKIDKYDPNSL